MSLVFWYCEYKCFVYTLPMGNSGACSLLNGWWRGFTPVKTNLPRRINATRAPVRPSTPDVSGWFLKMAAKAERGVNESVKHTHTHKNMEAVEYKKQHAASQHRCLNLWQNYNWNCHGCCFHIAFEVGFCTFNVLPLFSKTLTLKMDRLRRLDGGKTHSDASVHAISRLLTHSCPAIALRKQMKKHDEPKKQTYTCTK